MIGGAHPRPVGPANPPTEQRRLVVRAQTTPPNMTDPKKNTELHEVEAAGIAGVSVTQLKNLASQGHILPSIVLRGTTGRHGTAQARLSYPLHAAEKLREGLVSGEVPRPPEA
jgi:hypothetical protein